MVDYYITDGGVSMEDSMGCPKCSGTMRMKGTHWICSNSPWCGYQRDVAKPVLSQAELLEENKRLKETITKLVKELSPNIHKTS